MARPSATVRLYGTAQVSPEIKDAALVAAARALGDAVDVLWRDRAGADPRRPGELVVRFSRSSVSTPWLSFALGDAAIDVCTGAGVYATIYIDRVETMAGHSKSQVAVLLGRAIAHELGHLLLKTNDHSKGGLMRANWTPEEIRRNRDEDWLLTKEDVDAIQRRR